MLICALFSVSVAAGGLAGSYLELRAQAFVDVEGEPVQVVELARPTFTAEIDERLVLATTVEAALSQGRSSTAELERTLAAAGIPWPFEAERNEFLSISNASDYLRVERLFLDAYLPWADLRVGRQAIHWGSALLLNPTDPFPEVVLTEPWRSRRGINAVRATVPLGEDKQLQAIFGANDSFTAVRVAGRASITLGETDFSFVAAYREQSADGLFGVDIKGTLGIGYWFEGALNVGDEITAFEEVAIGVDYSFPVLEMLVVQAQYYHNGAGSGRFDVEQLGGRFGLTGEESQSAPLLLGRDYGMLFLSVGFTPEVSGALLWWQNLNDGSGLLAPSISYYPLDWLEVAAAAQVSFSLWGEGGELRPNPADLVMAIPTTLPRPAGDETTTIDFSGLVPAAVVTIWTRANF